MVRPRLRGFQFRCPCKHLHSTSQHNSFPCACSHGHSHSGLSRNTLRACFTVEKQTLRSEASSPHTHTLTKGMKSKCEFRFRLMPKSPALGVSLFSYVAATCGSGTGPLCTTQIRGTNISGEHLSVPAYGRTPALSHVGVWG